MGFWNFCLIFSILFTLKALPFNPLLVQKNSIYEASWLSNQSFTIS